MSARSITPRPYRRSVAAVAAAARRAVAGPPAAQDRRVAPGGTMRRWPRRLPFDRRGAVAVVGLDPGRLPDRIGQRLEVVGVRDRRGELAFVADDLPAPRHGQTQRVLLAQVVGVRLGERGQRADDGGGVRVHVGECRHRTPGTTGTHATSRRHRKPRWLTGWDGDPNHNRRHRRNRDRLRRGSPASPGPGDCAGQSAAPPSDRAPRSAATHVGTSAACDARRLGCPA